jgi:pimeloyl-ACP methyl ester carboxylesterase
MNHGIEPSERDIAVNGITIRIATWGEMTAPERAVLLVHGITANNRTWFTVGPALAARGWFPIALDLRGRGRSAKPPHGYGVPFHVNDLLSLSDALGVERPHLVGHSLGARIGIYYAALYPGRIGKLALVDAGGILPADTWEAISPALARLGATYPSLDAYLDAMLRSPHIRQDEFWDRYYRYDAQTLDDGSVVSGVPKTAIDEENAVNFFCQIDALPPHIKAPTLIVRATEGLLGGDRGQILPAAEAERLQTQIAGSRVVEVAGTNHYTIVTDDQFTAAVADFLEHPSGTP